MKAFPIFINNSPFVEILSADTPFYNKTLFNKTHRRVHSKQTRRLSRDSEYYSKREQRQ
jgi:hypothetical protein